MFYGWYLLFIEHRCPQRAVAAAEAVAEAGAEAGKGEDGGWQENLAKNTDTWTNKYGCEDLELSDAKEDL